jgi:hypothetical protein
MGVPPNGASTRFDDVCTGDTGDVESAIVDLAGQALGGDPEDALPAVAALRGELDDVEAAHVSAAVRRGWSWRRIGEALGVSKQAAHRKHSRRPLSPPTADEAARLIVSRDSRLVVLMARGEAAGRHDAVVGTEHLLLGLLQHGEGKAAAALAEVGVTVLNARVQADLFFPSQLAENTVPSALPLSKRARAALEQATREVARRGDRTLCPEHLLLALLRDPEAGAVRVLAGLGVSPEAIEGAIPA